MSKGLSEKAAGIVENCRRDSSTRTYSTPWNRWVLWCRAREENPFECDPIVVVNFLSELFHEGFMYRTLGVYRSAISAYHDPIEGIPVGQSKIVEKFMGGVDNLRPPKPKYTVVWDVDIVVRFLRSMGENEDLNWRSMNLRLATILAIASYRRAADLFLLDVRYCSISETQAVFNLAEKPKNHRKKGALPEPVVFQKSPDLALCPAESIRKYLEITSPFRDQQNAHRLFLSHLKPHKQVKKDTIRCWLKLVLQKAGIDVTRFQGHSIRAAASSKDKLSKGASIDQILTCGNWKNASVWRKFYCKPLVEL